MTGINPDAILSWLSHQYAAHNPGVSKYVWAGVAVAAGFLAASLGARLLSSVVRILFIAAGVLVAWRMLQGS